MILTFTTDFGSRDAYVGAMKGAALKHAPSATLVDITHDIRPQDVLSGAINILIAAQSFPPDTVHTVVVDPEVGSSRSGLIVRAWQQWFVAPDSGVLHFLLRESDAEIYQINHARAEVETTTFDGRDWFAPTAARLAAGSKIEELAQPIGLDDVAQLNIQAPAFEKYRWVGSVLHSDRFGNLISDLPAPPQDARPTARVFAGQHPFGPVRNAYAEVEPNKPVATIGSLNTVEAGLRDGHAQSHYRVRRGQTFEILFPEPVEPPTYPAWKPHHA